MQTQSKTDHIDTRLLTEDELNQVSGGALTQARHTFNPQPDPPGAMHNPPTY